MSGSGKPVYQGGEVGEKDVRLAADNYLHRTKAMLANPATCFRALVVVPEFA